MLIIAAAGAVLAFDNVDLSALRTALGTNSYAASLFLLLHICASLLFLPRTIIGIAAGLIFGPWLGFVLALLGAVAGGAAAFLLARHLNGGALVLNPNSSVQALVSRAAKGGWVSVMLFRLIPGIHHSLANYALGIAPVSLSNFLIGSAIAQIPSTALYMYISYHSEVLLTHRAAASWWSLISISLFAIVALAITAHRWRSTSLVPINHGAASLNADSQHACTNNTRPVRFFEFTNSSARGAAAMPWIELEPAELITAHRWVSIRYATSLLDDPDRPLLRFRTMNGREIYHVMNGAVCGSAEWIGRVPDGSVGVAISPTGRPGHFDFRIESVKGLPRIRLLARGLLMHPFHAIVAIGAWLINARDIAHERLQSAVCFTSLSFYDKWDKKHRRALDVDGIDALRPRHSRQPHFRIFVRLDPDADDALRTTLGSLQSQLYHNWTLYGIRSTQQDHTISPSQSVSDARLVVVDQSTTSSIDVKDDDFCAMVKPGDTVPNYSLAAIAEAISQNPDLTVVYGDEEIGGTAPIFRPDWSPIFQSASPYLGPLTCVRASALIPGYELDKFTSEHLFVDAAMTAAPGSVKHIRRILYCTNEVTKSPQPAPHLRKSAAVWPKVAVVIPTRDRADLLSRCIRGLEELTDYPDFQVVIVDNGSVEPQTLRLMQELDANPRYSVLLRPEQFNYSKLCNDGAAASDAPLLVFLNNDIGIKTPTWLQALVRWAVQPDVGAVGAKLLYPHWPVRDRIQHAGIALGLFELCGHPYSKAPIWTRGYLDRLLVPHEVSAVTGACLAIDRAKFDAVGGFDADNLPIDLNDVDLCLRLGERGWQCIWTPDAVLYHEESASRRKGLDHVKRYQAEREYFVSRWLHVIRDDPYFHPAFSIFSRGINLS